jgi:hypothetical protein
LASLFDGSLNKESKVGHASISLLEVFLAADRNEITIWILIEKFEIFGKALAESFDCLR